MSLLTYSALMSVDGYMADEDGKFDFAAPDEQLHRFINELERGMGTYLLGRRMYETMVWWEHPEPAEQLPDYIAEYAAIWQAAEKIVYSRTLSEVGSARTRIEREFDADAVRRLKESSAKDISIGGPTLAEAAFKAGLIDEVQLFVAPVAVGGGLPAFPLHAREELRLLEERRFDSGFVYLRYSTQR